MPNEESLKAANEEANQVFERMRELVEQSIERGETDINVMEVAQESGLELIERDLAELQIPTHVPIVRFVPWYQWYPWRPLWCWWWHRNYPWYRCCPYWWYRCHWCHC